jgi:hypothetical protein
MSVHEDVVATLMVSAGATRSLIAALAAESRSYARRSDSNLRREVILDDGGFGWSDDVAQLP